MSDRALMPRCRDCHREAGYVLLVYSTHYSTSPSVILDYCLPHGQERQANWERNGHPTNLKNRKWFA